MCRWKDAEAMTERVADQIVSALEAQDIERLYCVPGESYLALLDALHQSNRIATIACRHESGAGFMAVAEAKMTGRPAVFAVSRGPGATNGSIAIHVAQQDAVPVVVLIGQVSRAERGRGAFQEVDYTEFLGTMTKSVYEVHEAAKVGETMVRAFHRAAQGVPGPVAVVLPEDLLSDPATGGLPAPYPVHRPHASPDDAEAVMVRLERSSRPIVMAGGALRSARGVAALKNFAAAHGVPVAVTWKNQDLFDNSDPLYAGHLGVGNPPIHRKMLAQADLVIACGTRLGDIATQNYSFPRAPEPEQPLVHIYPDAAPIGAVFRTDLGIIADPAVLLDDLARRPSTTGPERETWVSRLGAFIDDFMAFEARAPGDGVDFGEVIAALADQAPADSIVITDAGNFSSWVHRHWRLSPRNLMLGAIGGAMGFGVPAGVAAGLLAPERTAIVVVGDGGMLMTGQEIATAVATGAAPKIFLSNNHSYGTIRTHQEKQFPGRISGTKLTNPDFGAWARAFGVHAVTIKLGDDVAAKVADALAHPGPCIVEVHSSLEAISAFATITGLRGG
jgi:acetolactate synthase I/II/III large subunit